MIFRENQRRMFWEEMFLETHRQPLFSLWVHPGETQCVGWQTGQCLWNDANHRTCEYQEAGQRCWIVQSENQNQTGSNPFYPPFPCLSLCFNHWTTIRPIPSLISCSEHLCSWGPEDQEVTGSQGTWEKVREWRPLAYKRNNERSYDSCFQMFKSLSVKDKTPLLHEAPKS